MMKSRLIKDTLIRYVFFLMAFISIAILAMILFFLVREGVPIFDEVSVKNFFLGQILVSPRLIPRISESCPLSWRP